MNPTNDAVCVDSIRYIMQIFGGKWTFFVMGELHNGPRRFNDLNRSIGCSTKSLSDTLKILEKYEIISRTVFSTTPVTIEYALTKKGKDFEKVFTEMHNWGKKWL